MVFIEGFLKPAFKQPASPSVPQLNQQKQLQQNKYVTNKTTGEQVKKVQVVQTAQAVKTAALATKNNFAQKLQCCSLLFSQVMCLKPYMCTVNSLIYVVTVPSVCLKGVKKAKNSKRAYVWL